MGTAKGLRHDDEALLYLHRINRTLRHFWFLYRFAKSKNDTKAKSRVSLLV
jgi:hypothetical protein